MTITVNHELRYSYVPLQFATAMRISTAVIWRTSFVSGALGFVLGCYRMLSASLAFRLVLRREGGRACLFVARMPLPTFV